MDSPLLHDLKKLPGPDGLLHKPDDLLWYEYDGSVETAKPSIRTEFSRQLRAGVAMQATGKEVRHVVELLDRALSIPVAR